MIKPIIVIDNFYNDVLEVRNLALRSDFCVHGNYPGRRTGPFLHGGIRQGVQELVQNEIIFWPEDTYNGAFQITTSSDKSWIHSDHTTNYAGAVFLTPDAPMSAGTAFYRHVATGYSYYPEDPAQQAVCDRDAPHVERWTATDYVANVFNRLVLFDSRRFHSSANYFGSNLQDGRLFQTFFFSVAL